MFTMPMQMAQPTFISGPDDKLATVDVYTQTSNAVINNRPDSWQTANFGSVGSLLGNKSMLGNLPLGGNINGLINAGMNTLTSRLGITNPALAKAVKALTPLATKALEKALPMGKINAVLATAGSVTRVMDMAKSGNFMGVVGSVNNIAQMAGVPGISMADPKGMIALSQGLVTQGIYSGVPGVLTTLKSSNLIPSNGAMNAVVRGAMPAVIQKGDLGTFKEFSTVLGEFSRSYPAPELPRTTGQYQSDFSDIKESFGSVDSEWRTVSIEPVEAGSVNASALIEASPEFKKTVTIGAMNSSDPEDKWLLATTAPSEESSPPNGITQKQWNAMQGMKLEDMSLTTTPYSSASDVPRDANGYPLGVSKSDGSQNQTPVQRADSLYPAAATIGNETKAPIDPRVVSEKQRVDEIQKQLNTFSLPSRTAEELRREMEQEETRWADRYQEEIAPIFMAANQAKAAGDTALYDQKTTEGRAAETSMKTYFEKRIAKIKADLAKWDEYEALKRQRGQ
jgi:hypothetical protein